MNLSSQFQPKSWFEYFNTIRTVWQIGLLLGATAVICLIVACQTEPAPPPPLPAEDAPTLLQIGVTSSADQIVPLIKAVYSPPAHATVQYVVANSKALYDDLANGQLDGILVHHIPEGNGRYFNPIALDGLAILTHPDNPINSLTRAEVQAIFNGRLTNWQEVGGQNAPILLLSREEGSGLHTLLRQHLMAEQRISANALLQSGNDAMLNTLGANPTAIGFSSMSSASQTQTAKLLQLDGRLPTPFTTADQSYSLTTPLYFVAATPAEPIGELRGFLAWLQSDDGQTQLGAVYGRIR